MFGGELIRNTSYVSQPKELTAWVAKKVRMVAMPQKNISITEQQLPTIRRLLREGMEDIKAGRFTEYEGLEDRKKLADV